MFRALSVAMAALFFFGAAVQYNDPDPARWMAIYGAAAVVCLLTALQRPRRPWTWALPAALALAALLWANLGIGVQAARRVPFAQLFAQFEMTGVAVEEEREYFGLLIIAAWMGILTATGLIGTRKKEKGKRKKDKR